MALLVFPTPAFNGQIYPATPLPGQNVYQWDAAEQTWRLIGTATGVIAGTYGTPLQIPQFTVDPAGRITFAQNIDIQKTSKTQLGVVRIGDRLDVDAATGILSVPVATVSIPGVVIVGNNLNISAAGLLSVPNATTGIRGAVMLVNNTVTNDATKALTAAAGFSLQQQINALVVSNNLTFAGTINANTGTIASVTPEGTSAGFTIGQPLPTPTVQRDEYFVVVTTPGTFTPTGSSTPISANDGDWFVAIDGVWTYFNVGPDVPRATFVQLDDIAGDFDGGRTIFTLSVNGNPYTPGTNANVLISLGGVLQIPGDSFNIVGDSVSFSVPPASDTTFLGYALSGVSGGGGIAGSGTVTQVNTGTGLTGGPITTSGVVSLVPATAGVIGGVRPDTTTITISPAGVISAVGGTLNSVTTNGNTTTNSITVGALTANGNVILGDNGSDTVDVNGRFIGSLIPAASALYDLGSAALPWRDLYVSASSIYMGTDQLTVSGGQLFLNGVPIGGGSTIDLQGVTDNGSVTTDPITVGGLTAASLIYPLTDGAPGQVIATDGAGNLGWVSAAASSGITNLGTGPGLTGGPITTTGTISLTNTGVSPNTYTYATITVDINGRITVASSGNAPNTAVSSPITNTGTAIAPIIGIQRATTGQLGAVQIGTNIDVVGGVISVNSSTTSQSGIVQLNDTVSSTSVTEALTAKQGKALQDQISTLAVTSNLTLAGTFDATANQMLTVTSQGTSQSFVIGNNLPAAAAGNLDYFVIVTTGGAYNPPGGGGPYTTNQGDWFLSNGTSWQFLNVGSDLPTASTGTAGVVALATTAETQIGTNTTKAVTPAGAAATYLPISSFIAKGSLLSATGASVPTALPVGSDNQILTACSLATTGLCWVTPPVVVPSIPCSVLTAKGALVAASGANTPATLPVGVDGQILAACSTETTGLCWITPPAPVTQATPTTLGTVFGRVDLGSGGLGFRALNSLTTGTFNVGIGESAGCSITTGNRNVAVGALALELGTTICDNVGLGVEALRRTTTGGRNVAIGTTTLVFNTTGADNVAVGYDAGRANTTGFQNTAIGYQSTRINNTFSQNTAVGAFTLCAFNGGTNGANDAFGALAMQAFTTGDYNVALGAYSLFCYTSGCFNTAVGHRSMTDVTTGTCNTAIGAYSGQNLTTGCFNTAVGYQALVCNGDNNTVIGRGAMNVSGASNSVTLGNSSITVIRAQVTSITALSDARDKTDVTALPVGLDFVNSLNPVKFTWQMREPNEVKDGTSEAGFIAQDLQTAQEAAGADYLGLVYDADPEKLEASAGKLIPVLVKAIQELSGKVDSLQEELDKLKAND